MKFTCEKNQLVSAISVASRTVAQKSAISGLEGILVRAGVKVMLTGYNLETGITVSVDADIQETGACVMPARLFSTSSASSQTTPLAFRLTRASRFPSRAASHRLRSLRSLPTITPSFRTWTPKKVSASRRTSSRP